MSNSYPSTLYYQENKPIKPNLLDGLFHNNEDSSYCQNKETQGAINACIDVLNFVIG